MMGRKACKGLDLKDLCLLVALCVVIAGCGTTGATKTFVLPIDSAATSSIEHPLELGSFAASGAVVYEEQFYAANSVVLVGALGGVKNSVNRAVARRIIESSLRFASSESLSSTRVEGTYDTIAEAAKTLPDQYRSLPVVQFHRLTDEIVVPSVARPQDETTRTVDWEALDATEPVNWLQRIKG